MANFNFYFDGNLIPNPHEWRDFKEVIEFNASNKGLLLKFPSEMTFSGSAYSYLNNLFKTNGYCNLVSIDCEYSCNGILFEPIFKGKIFISDCVFNISKCTVQVTIMDDGWYSRIDNNKKIKAFLDANKSKNGIPITQCTDLQLYLFDSTGSYSSTKRIAYDVGDAFRYLIDFMTDGNVGFVSSWYSGLTNKIALSIGNELRCPAAGNSCGTNNCLPENDITKGISISFEELFDEMSKKFNLIFLIEDINGKPTVRIEPESYLYDTTTVETVLNINNLTRLVNTERLYARLLLGSDKVASYDPNIHSLPPLKFVTFQKEEYHTTGTCNKDRTLDTISKFIIDSNIIEGCAFTDGCNREFDEDVFFIEYYNNNNIGNYATIFVLNPGGYVANYNDSFTNDKVSIRYSVQGDIVAYVSALQNIFKATDNPETPRFNLRPGDPSRWPGVLVHPPTTNGVGTYVGNYLFPFNNDTLPGMYDPGNNFDVTNHIYIVPVSGTYNFGASVNFKTLTNCLITSPRFTTAYQRIRITRFNSGFTPIEHREKYSYYMAGGPGTMQFAPFSINNAIFNCNIGDLIGVVIDMYFEWADSGGITICHSYEFGWSTGGEFYCISAPTGGVYQINDPNLYNVSLYQFTAPINNTTWQLIKANKNHAIDFSTDGNVRYKGWIRKIDRNISDSMADFEIVTNIINTI